MIRLPTSYILNFAFLFLLRILHFVKISLKIVHIDNYFLRGYYFLNLANQFILSYLLDKVN